MLVNFFMRIVHFLALFLFSCISFTDDSRCPSLSLLLPCKFGTFLWVSSLYRVLSLEPSITDRFYQALPVSHSGRIRFVPIQHAITCSTLLNEFVVPVVDSGWISAISVLSTNLAVAVIMMVVAGFFTVNAVLAVILLKMVRQYSTSLTACMLFLYFILCILYVISVKLKRLLLYSLIVSVQNRK